MTKNMKDVQDSLRHVVDAELTKLTIKKQELLKQLKEIEEQRESQLRYLQHNTSMEDVQPMTTKDFSVGRVVYLESWKGLTAPHGHTFVMVIEEVFSYGQFKSNGHWYNMSECYVLKDDEDKGGF